MTISYVSATYYIRVGLQWKVADHTTLQSPTGGCWPPSVSMKFEV